MTTILNKAPSGAALLLFAVLSLFAAPQAARADDTEAAKVLVTALVDETAQTFSGEAMDNDTRAAKLKAMIAKYGDVGVSSQDILGRYWGRTTEGQRNTFVELVVDYAIASWAKQLSNLPPNQHYEITTAEVLDNGHTVIHSLAINPNDITPVDWVATRNTAGRLIIVDASVEGISVIKTMSGDFLAIIRANGGKIEALFDALRAKMASYQSAAR